MRNGTTRVARPPATGPPGHGSAPATAAPTPQRIRSVSAPTPTGARRCTRNFAMATARPRTQPPTPTLTPKVPLPTAGTRAAHLGAGQQLAAVEGGVGARTGKRRREAWRLRGSPRCALQHTARRRWDTLLLRAAHPGRIHFKSTHSAARARGAHRRAGLRSCSISHCSPGLGNAAAADPAFVRRTLTQVQQMPQIHMLHVTDVTYVYIHVYIYAVHASRCRCGWLRPRLATMQSRTPLGLSKSACPPCMRYASSPCIRCAPVPAWTRCRGRCLRLACTEMFGVFQIQVCVRACRCARSRRWICSMRLRGAHRNGSGILATRHEWTEGVRWPPSISACHHATCFSCRTHAPFGFV